MRQRGDLAADATSALVVDTRALPQLHLDGRRRRRDRRVVVAAVAVAVLAGAGAAVGRFADPARAPRAPAAAAATDVVLARRDEQRVRWRRALLRARSRREQAAVAARVADAYDAAARKLRLASPRIDGGAQATAASALAAAYAS